MAKKYVCKACNKACKSDITHACHQTCSDCMARTPCTFSDVRFPCNDCDLHFRIRSYFANKYNTAKRKSVCERKWCCTTCGLLVTDDSHECNKLFCANCKQNRDVGHLCYMKSLKDVLPSANDILRFWGESKYEVLWKGHITRIWSRLHAKVLFAMWRCGRLRRVRAMRKEDAFVLGRTGRVNAIIPTLATRLGQ